MFAGIHERTDGVDGWGSLEVSPLLAYALAAKLQADAATSFVESWNDLLEIIDRQSATLTA